MTVQVLPGGRVPGWGGEVGGIETGSDPDFFGKFPEMIFECWEGVLGSWGMVLRGDGE